LHARHVAKLSQRRQPKKGNKNRLANTKATDKRIANLNVNRKIASTRRIAHPPTAILYPFTIANHSLTRTMPLPNATWPSFCGSHSAFDSPFGCTRCLFTWEFEEFILEFLDRIWRDQKVCIIKKEFSNFEKFFTN